MTQIRLYVALQCVLVIAAVFCRRPTGVRPASTASTVSTLDSLRSDSPDSLPDSQGRPRLPATPPSAAPTLEGGNRPMNVYRAGFSDTLSHQTAVRKSASTYTSGHKDWWLRRICCPFKKKEKNNYLSLFVLFCFLFVCLSVCLLSQCLVVSALSYSAWCQIRALLCCCLEKETICILLFSSFLNFSYTFLELKFFWLVSKCT